MLLAIFVGGPRGLATLLMVGILAVVALDLVVAIQATRRVRLAASAHPTSLIVGDHFTLELRVDGPALPVLVHLPSNSAAMALSVQAPQTGPLDGLASARGVIHNLPLSVISAGLCGLLSCSRSHRVHLAQPVEVGPRPVVPSRPFPELAGGWGEGAAAAVPDGELVRGLRDYLPGDALRQVHWRATAHTGELVVKETEEPQAPVLHLVLDMGAGGEAGEAAAGRCVWYAAEALRRGHQVTLTTVEDGYPLTDATPSLRSVNRRLARAGLGPAPRPKGVARGVRVLVVADDGDLWP